MCLRTESNSAPLVVSVKMNPSASMLTISGSDSLCKGMATLIHSSTQVGLQWFKDDVLINGLIDSVYRTDEAGKYKVMTNSNGCLSPFSNEITIATNPIPVPSITATATSFCSGDSTTLTANNVAGYTYQWNSNEEQVPGATSAVLVSKNGGNFSVLESDNNGCTAKSKIVAIIKTPSPPKPTISKSSATLKSSASNGNQWYRDGVIIAGATSQTLNPTTNGNYSVQVTQNGCKSSMSDPYSFIVTSLVSIDNSHFIRLSPNPVQNEMKLDFRLNGVLLLNVDLLDLNGRIVKRWKEQTTGSVLSISDCATSMYLARVFSTKGKINATLKLVKQ